MAEYMLHFSASDALYENGTLSASQEPTMTLGPFPDYIELTYEWLRVGPDGETIAVYNDTEGIWRLVKREQHGIWTSVSTDDDGPGFSDVVIMAV